MLMVYNYCQLWVLILILIVFFPFYLIYLQFGFSSTDTGRSSPAFSRNDNEIFHDIELIVSTLEEEHQLLKRIVNHVDQLITTAAVALEDSPNEENIAKLNNIKSSLRASRKSLHRTAVDSLSSSSSNEIGLDRGLPADKVIPPPNILSTDDNMSKSNCVLIVGGTDGSGTRRVVQVLTDLGVLMVSEDPETYDIHADSVGGWPPTVTTVLRETKSLNYNIRSLAVSTQNRVKSSANQIIKQAEVDSTKPTSTRLAVGGQLPRPQGHLASGVKYGFKAPVSMTLVPVWAELLPDFKFLHVVRDGRDIAFSANQGPVEKFYSYMYDTRSADTAENAIRLWSDWNTQIYDWAKNRVSQASQGPSEQSFSYYSLHAEDLVSASRSIRFAAIYHLAKWVGSNLDDDELCCFAVKDAAFLGSHDRDLRQQIKNNNQVSSRYGKWKELLQGNPTQEANLMRVGKKGLDVFGYEPLRELADDGDSTASGYTCKLTEAICIERKILQAPAAAVASDPKYSMNGQCKTYSNTDYKGSDIKWYPYRLQDPGHCCRECKANPNCHHFTIDLRSNICYHKSSRGHVVNDAVVELVSGDA
jgi:hypothetical protein